MNLQRRPLSKAKIKIAYLTAGSGGIDIDGERIHYSPLVDEFWSPLLKYMSEDGARLREFLLEDSCAWDFDRNTPIYLVGWPGGPKLTVTGPKACAAALRRWYPLRDHEASEGDSVDPTPVEMASPAASKVVSIRPNAPTVIRGILDQQRYEDRS